MLWGHQGCAMSFRTDALIRHRARISVCGCLAFWLACFMKKMDRDQYICIRCNPVYSIDISWGPASIRPLSGGFIAALWVSTYTIHHHGDPIEHQHVHQTILCLSGDYLADSIAVSCGPSASASYPVTIRCIPLIYHGGPAVIRCVRRIPLMSRGVWGLECIW